MGTGDSPSVCLGPKRKKHREHLWQKLLQLWCPSALNTNPPAGNDMDHKTHLCMVNAGPPSSGVLCTRCCLCVCPRCRQSFGCWQHWRCCPTVSEPCEHCSAAASCAASPAWLPCQVPLPPAWGSVQLHDLAECLKQFKISMLGKKKINTLTKERPQLQRHSHCSLLSCLSTNRLSVGWEVEEEEQGWGVNKVNDS